METPNTLPEVKKFDIESQKRVNSFFESVQADIREVIDASDFSPTTRDEMNRFYDQFLININDDTLVGRKWVTFGQDGAILRARSEDGTYDVVNTSRYFVEEFCGTFLEGTHLALSGQGRMAKEAQELKRSIISILEQKLNTEEGM